MYYVYVLRSLKDRKLYVGYTPNLESRFKKHNRKEVMSTKARAPFELIYYEAYKNREDATSREKYYKTGWAELI
jgi:putative endonuclease